MHIESYTHKSSDFLGMLLFFGIIGIVVFIVWVIYLYKEKERLRELLNGAQELEQIATKKKNEILQFKKTVDLKIQQDQESLDRKRQKLDFKEKAISKLVEEKTLGFPWLLQVFQDAISTVEGNVVKYLMNKPNPALKSADIVREATRLKAQAVRDMKEAQYKVVYYEHLFPWLEDLIGAPDNLVSISNDTAINSHNDDPSTHWLSQAEYETLPLSKKHQLALERYLHRNKSNWEIGREYERYVGYLYELEGWKASYIGAIQGFEDMGRDIIVKKGKKAKIIQCKLWSKQKTIHEKHIFQLFGTTIEWLLSTKKWTEGSNISEFLNKANVTPSFYTSTCLSDTARNVAKALSIETIEHFPLQDYPCIKCHADTKTGEKIFHLPFDQQYDRIGMSLTHGDKYVSTVLEAEKLGFRRAYRWKGITA